jgi:hypothetical protein
MSGIRTPSCKKLVLRMKPKFHKILQETQVINQEGKQVTRYVLRYNFKLFEGGTCKGLDVETFYPPQDTFTYTEEKMVSKMCADCPVMMACLEWGLAHERYGIWGGTTPNRRKKLRRLMKIQMTEPRI